MKQHYHLLTQVCMGATFSSGCEMVCVCLGGRGGQQNRRLLAMQPLQTAHITTRTHTPAPPPLLCLFHQHQHQHPPTPLSLSPPPPPPGLRSSQLYDYCRYEPDPGAQPPYDPRQEFRSYDCIYPLWQVRAGPWQC
jgi:hypothetical protein